MAKNLKCFRIGLLVALLTSTGIVFSQTSPTPGGTLQIAYTATSPHLDIQGTNQGTLAEPAHYIYETLFDRDPEGEIVGLLAREYEVSDDGLTYTFELQPDVMFHDGTPWDAEAALYNLRRKIDLELPTYDSIPWDDFNVLDELTLEVTLSAPAPHILNVLAAKTWSMYSPTHAEEAGADGLLNEAVGTGPFVLEEFRPNEELRLVRNPDYWQEGLPYLDGVTFRVVTDANTRAALLESGEIDIAFGLPTQITQRLAMDPRFNILEGTGSRQFYFPLNNRLAPTDDVLVRQAINHAVDKEGIIQAVFMGAGAEIADAVYLNPTVNGYTSAGVWEYDPERAEALLEEAGWAADGKGGRVRDGEQLELKLYTRRGATAGDFETAELVQGMLADVGIKVDMVVLESASYVSAVTVEPEEADYHMANLSVGIVTGDAEYIMSTFYHSSSFSPRLYNRAYYSNPEVDRLIEESRLLGDLEERNALYAEIIPLVFNDAPILQLFDEIEFLATNARVHDIYFEPTFNNWPAKYAWLEQ